MAKMVLSPLEEKLVQERELLKEQVEKLAKSNAGLLQENRVLTNKQNKFGLTFKRIPEQGEAQRLINGELPYLTKVHELSVVKDDNKKNQDHLLIDGDNITALTMMQRTHRGKVDVIYIDPPYNTGNKDFVYNDSYVANDDGFRHSKWLSFMEPRLLLARNLLSETGVIFVSIDDNEQAALKMLMDRVFGEMNFVENLLWLKASGNNNSKLVSNKHEYVVTYAKNKECLDSAYFQQEKSGYTGVQKLMSEMSSQKLSNEKMTAKVKEFYKNNKVSQGIKNYNRVSEDNRLFRLDNLGNPGKNMHLNPSYNYELYHPVTNRLLEMPKRGWLYREENMLSMIAEGRIYLESNTPQLIRYLDSTAFENMSSYFYETSLGYREVSNVLGEGAFDYPKPVDLLLRFLRAHPNPNAIVLDFFAGSGTTGHAVAALNAEDGGNRQAILITNNFEQDGSPNGIARDVTAARMKAVLTGQWADKKPHDALPGNLHYYRIDFADPVAFEDKEDFPVEDYVGVAALSANSHCVVENVSEISDTPFDDLQDSIDEGSAVLLSSGDSLTLVYGDYDGVVFYSSEFMKTVENFNNLAVLVGADKVSAYVVSDNSAVLGADLFNSAVEVSSYPTVFFDSVDRAISSMVNSEMLMRDSGTVEIEV